MKKWRVELESQNEQTRHTESERERRLIVTQLLSIKEAVEERREVPLRGKLC